jgi:hypothetical protein
VPAYNTSGTESLAVNPVLPSVLLPGDQKYLFGTTPYLPGQVSEPNDANVVTEAVILDERSIAIQLAPRPGGGAPPGLHVIAIASANPGAAEIDIQDAGIDADGAYQTQTTSPAYKMTVWTQEGPVWVASTQLQPEGGKFLTALIVANPNAVSFIVKAMYV